MITFVIDRPITIVIIIILVGIDGVIMKGIGKIKRSWRLNGLLRNANRRLLESFWQYHRNNPHVYNEFKNHCLAMYDSGRKRYGAWCVINKIRWDYDLKVQGKDKFKISNGYIAFFARMLIAEHPELDGFFQLKKLGGNHDTE